MDTKEAVDLAATFLESRQIGFTDPVWVVARSEALLEVIFTVPEALDPNIVVDPSDIRVLVDATTRGVSLVTQM